MKKMIIFVILERVKDYLNRTLKALIIKKRDKYIILYIYSIFILL